MTDVKLRAIDRDLINSAMTYDEYRELIDTLMDNGKTTGENHSDAMIHYTKMNVHRMKRLDRRIDISDELETELKNLNRQWIWLVLTEAWCGDAAQSIPIINKVAEVTENIQLRFILRDENLDIMDQFLQRGRSRSIPKLICLDAESLEVLGDWGPRPEEAQGLYDTMRGSSQMAYQEVAEHLHKWYADDKGEEIMDELLQNVKRWKK